MHLDLRNIVVHVHRSFTLLVKQQCCVTAANQIVCEPILFTTPYGIRLMHSLFNRTAELQCKLTISDLATGASSHAQCNALCAGQ